MPSIHEFFDFYLSAEDLQEKSHLVTIEYARPADVFNPRARKNETKLSVRFYKAKLLLIINKTQALSLETITGTDDYTKWAGHQVLITPVAAPNGKDTIAISRPPEKPKEKPPTPPAAQPDPEPDPEPETPADNDPALRA